jgi:acetyl esterase/lipase
MRARLVRGLVLSLLLALPAAGCGGPGRRERPAPVRAIPVGAGERGAVVLVTPGPTARRPVVVFLHGAFATDPRTYGPWLDHLAREGEVVIYPRYQGALTPPARFLSNALAGVRAALARVPADRRALVVAGHSAGGALAADYGAVAPRVGLPPARAVFAAYPGRGLRGLRAPALQIPAAEGRLVPPRTRILALASPRDRTVGTATARAIVRAARRVPARLRTLRLVSDRGVADHLGPQRASLAARRVFWVPLDRLVASARGVAAESGARVLG